MDYHAHRGNISNVLRSISCSQLPIGTNATIQAADMALCMFYFDIGMVDDLEFLLDIDYLKILKINIDDDSYQIIKMLDYETPLSETLSG